MISEFDRMFENLFRHARSTDPLTSHEAVPDNIKAQALAVLKSYRNGKPMTDHEAYMLAGFDPRLARQRCSDLRHYKFIERTGDRGPTPFGKSGDLCRITDAGLACLASVEKRDA